MATGTVRFYNDAKGFGLITPDTGGPALFAHSADIRGGKKLKARQLVEYDVAETPEGSRAANIKML
jgi:cold shock protein